MNKNPFTAEESVLLRYLPEYARAIERWEALREHVEVLAHNIQAAHVRWMGWSYEEGIDAESISENNSSEISGNGIPVALSSFSFGCGTLYIDDEENERKSTYPAFVTFDIDGPSQLIVKLDFREISWRIMGRGSQHEAAALVANAHPGFTNSPWERLEDHDKKLITTSNWGYKQALRLHWDRVNVPISDAPVPHPWCPNLLPCLSEIHGAIRAIRKSIKDKL